MKNKIHSLVLIVLMFTGSFSTLLAQYTLTLNDVSFDATTGTINDYTNTTQKDIIIPSYFNVNGVNVSVITIGVKAFAYNGLNSVSIPNSVTTIGKGAFSNNTLSSVSIPSSVTTIRASAFINNSLTYICIPNSVTIIEASAFAGHQITNIDIPNSVTTLIPREGEVIEFDFLWPVFTYSYLEVNKIHHTIGYNKHEIYIELRHKCNRFLKLQEDEEDYNRFRNRYDSEQNPFHKQKSYSFSKGGWKESDY